MSINNISTQRLYNNDSKYGQSPNPYVVTTDSPFGTFRKIKIGDNAVEVEKHTSCFMKVGTDVSNTSKCDSDESNNDKCLIDNGYNDPKAIRCFLSILIICTLLLVALIIAVVVLHF